MTAKPASTKKRPRTVDLVTVTLVCDHEHQGERKAAGEQISVHPETAQWLRAQGVISNSQKD